MANSINGAGASASFVVSSSGAAPKYARARRHALLGSSALIGMAISASPAGAQSFPVGGGTIVVNGGGTTTNDTGANGGFENTDGQSLTITDVTINNTTGSPTVDAIRFTRTSFSVSGDGFSFTGTNSLVAASGGAGMNFSSTGGNNSGIGFNGTLNVTGFNGIVASSNGAIFHSGNATFNLTAQTPGFGSGLLWTAANSCICDTSLTGAFNSTNFQFGANLSARDVFFTTGSGGAITGAFTGVRANSSAGNVTLSIGSSISASSTGINGTATGGAYNVTATGAINAPVGISAVTNNGGTITTSGGGTINGSSLGIFVLSLSGSGALNVNVGAAIGNTSAPANAVNVTATSSSTSAISVVTSAPVTAGVDAIAITRAAGTPTNTVTIGANATGGSSGVNGFSAGTTNYTVQAGATVTGNGSGSNQGGIVTNSSAATVMNSGTITSTGTTANNAGVLNASSAATTNTATGMISGYFGLDQRSSSSTTTNAGTITGTGTAAGAAAVRTFGGTLTNTGSITGGAAGVLTSGNIFTVNNTAGTITGATNAIEMTGGFLRLNNTGTVQTTGGTAGAGLAGVYLNVSNAASDQQITNSGTISGGSNATHGYGVDVDDGSLVLINQSGGTITGGIGAIRIASNDVANINLASGSTTTGNIVSSNSGARTLTVTGLLSGDYNASAGTGATTVTLNTGGSIQSVSMGNTAGTFNWNGGTVGGTLAGGSNLSTFNFNIGAANTASLASISRFFGTVTSGTLILNGQTDINGAWNVGATGLLRIGSSITLTTISTFASLSTAGGRLQVDSGATLSLAGSGINVAGGNMANPINVTTNGTLIAQTAGGGTDLGGGNFASGYAINNNGGGFLTVTNTGTIQTGDFNFTAAIKNALTTIVTNSGTIQGGATGSTLRTYGAQSSGGTLTLNNTTASSVIAGGAQGVLTTGGTLNVTNAGFIVGTGDAINAAGTTTITNNVGGTIGTGTVSGGVFTAGGTGSAISTAGSATVVNNGTLYGNAYGFVTNATNSVLTLTNRGTITSGTLGDAVATFGTANVINSGTISTSVFSAVNALGGGSIVNATGGVLTGGNDATFGEAVQFAAGTASFTNYGSASSAIGRGVFVNGAAATAINLHAGSTTGSILTGSGNDTLALFNGRGTASAATVDGPSGITLQNAGTLAGATVGAIDLGSGTNTLALRGTGDGTAANGAIGVLSASSITGLSNLNKLDSGTWNITSGALSYTGGTNVQSGRLVFVNRTAPAGTATISSGATLEFNLSGGTYFQDGATFNGAGTLVKSGIGLLANRSLISLAAGGLIDVQGGMLSGSSDGQGRFTGNLASLNIASGATFDGVEGVVIVDALTGAGTLRGGFFGSGSTTIGIANGSGTFSGTIRDSLNVPSPLILIKAGTGTQTLTGTNIHTGTTTISGGTLALGGTATFASSAITNNATFDIAGHTGGVSVLNLLGSGTTTLGANTLTITNASGTYSGSISGTGGLIKQGAGSYTLSGANSFTGSTMVQAGSLVFGANDVIADASALVVSSGATVNLNSFSDTVSSLAGSGSVTLGSGTLSVGADNSSTSFLGVISGSGGLTKLGAGTLTLTGANSFTGTLLVSAGTLAYGANNVVSDSASVTVNSGATLDLASFSDTIGVLAGPGNVMLGSGTLTVGASNGDATFSGVASGTGGLIKVGTGTQTLSGANSFTGDVVISGGTLAYGANNVLADTVTVTVNSGATFNLNGFSDTIGTLNLHGTLTNGGLLTAGVYNAYAGSTIGQAISSGTLNVLGDTALTAATTATPVNITAGTLTTSAAELLSDTGAVAIASGAQLTLGGAETIGSLVDGSGSGGTVQLAGFGLTVSGNDSTTFSGAIQSSVAGGSLTKNGTGTLTLTGANTGLDAIVINAGTLSVASTFNLGATGTIGLLGGTLATTGSFTTDRTLTTSAAAPGGGINVASGTVFGVNGALSGDGALAKSGLGTLNLLAANTGFSGDIFVNGGAVRAGNSQAFGIGTIHLVDPALIYGATGSYANAILLEVQSPASADPATLRAESGVTATIAGAITQGTGTGVDASQPLVIDGPGRIVLANAANLWAGTTTINTGATLQGTTGTISGSAIVDNGLLVLSQPASGTFARNVSGSGIVQVTGLAAGQALTLSGVLANSQGVQVLDGSALSITGSVAATGTSNAVALNNTNVAGVTSVLNNSGQITSASFGVTSRGSVNLTNSGSIVAAAGVFLSSGGTVTNAATGQITGTSTAGGTAIFAQGGALTLTNQGSVTGAAGIAIATMGAFNDSIDLQAGSITNGSVTTAGGADSFTLGLGATLNGAIDGGAGDDQLIVTGAGSSTLASAIRSVESLTMNGSGTLTLGGTNVGLTTVAVNSGTLNVIGSAAIDDLAAVTVASGAMLGVQTDETVGTLALAGTLAGTGTLTASEYQLTGATVNANLGAGVLTQVDGTSVLNGTAAATSVAINGGTLTLGASDRLANAATVSVLSGATLNLGAFNDMVGTLALAGTLVGTGTLTADQYQLTGGSVNANLGAGILFQLGGTSMLNGTAAATNVMVQGGTLTLGASNRLADAANVGVSTGASLNLGGNLETVGILQLGGTLGGTGTLTASQYQLTAATANANLGAGTLFQLGGTSVLNGTAAASTVMVNGGTLTLGGNERLADTAAVQVAGGATFNLAGRTETIGSFGGTGTVALGAGRLVAGGSNGDFGFGGNITGSGDLDKVGTGTFTLASNLAQTGRLNLNAGTTQFVGSTAGSVRVQGGTLTGSAAIAGNLTVASGTFSPGTATQPIAMFTAGSFNASGGTLTFDLGGPATGFAADMINVSGAAVLSGGTVFTRPLEATANYRVSQNYVLLRSGSLTGTFANGATFAPTGTNPDLQWRLRYDLLPNAVVLELRKQIDFTADLGPNASGNELVVGAALNGGAFMASDNWAGILNTINSQDPATRRATFNSISGEAISDISSATTIATSGFTDLLRQRLALGGGTSGNANLLSGLVGGKQALVALAASTPLDGAALPTDSAYASSTDDEKRGGVWLQGYGANGRIDGLTGQAGVDTFSAGVAGGIDARFGNVTVGGAFAVSQVETKVRARTSTNEGTLYQGGGYVAYDNGRLYGSVIGSYFSGDINSRRSVFVGGALFGVANGTAATRGYTGGAALGYRVPLSQSLLFTPQVSFTATGVTRDAFTETGAGGLSLQAARERREIYAATAEGRLSRPFNALGGTVEPYIGGGAVYSFGDLDTVSTNRFSGAPVGTGTFSIQGARLSPVTALVNGGINVRPSQNVRLGLQGEARLSQRQREERISLNLRIGF